MLRNRFREGCSEIEMDAVAADGAADLRVGRTQVAMLVVRQRLILRLFRQRMRDAVRQRALLCEQQNEDEKQRQEQAGRFHGGATITNGVCGRKARFFLEDPYAE